MQKVYLNGPISKFGAEWNVAVPNVGDVFKLIACQSPGFQKYIFEILENKTTTLEVVKGSEVLRDMEDILLPLEKDDLIITEVPCGAGDNPLETFLIGLTIWFAPHLYAMMTNPAVQGMLGAKGAIAAVGTGFSIGGIVASIGMGLMINSVLSLFVSGPETDAISGDMEAEKAKIFNGPVTVAKQGIPVPVLYGELAIGGANINQGFSVGEDTTEMKVFPQYFRDQFGEQLTNRGDIS